MACAEHQRVSTSEQQSPVDWDRYQEPSLQALNAFQMMLPLPYYHSNVCRTVEAKDQSNTNAQFCASQAFLQGNSYCSSVSCNSKDIVF